MSFGLWACWALWPGCEPVLMGKVQASTMENAWEIASRTWPQVPCWRIE